MNNFDVVEIFSTPIGVFKYDKEKFLKNKIEKFIQNNTSEKNGKCEQLKHYGDNVGDSVLEYKMFYEFKQWVIECGLKYCGEILGYDIKDSIIITDSWINVADTNAFQFPHMHVNSFISGTYYVNKNHKHSPIIFRHPKNMENNNNKPIIIMPTKTPTRYNTDAIIDVTDGTLLLWESFVYHGYHNNLSDNRISLSMNMMPSSISNGRYGYKISKS